jgi:hypothetical protein
MIDPATAAGVGLGAASLALELVEDIIECMHDSILV